MVFIYVFFMFCCFFPLDGRLIFFEPGASLHLYIHVYFIFFCQGYRYTFLDLRGLASLWDHEWTWHSSKRRLAKVNLQMQVAVRQWYCHCVLRPGLWFDSVRYCEVAFGSIIGLYNRSLFGRRCYGVLLPIVSLHFPFGDWKHQLNRQNKKWLSICLLQEFPYIWHDKRSFLLLPI